MPFDLATTKGFFPVGIDYEIYRAEIMRKIHESVNLSKSEKEHLTLYFYNNKQLFNIVNIFPKKEWKSNNIFTVDTKADYLKIKNIVSKNKLDIDSFISVDQ